jgi:hypothetical protein
MPLSGGDIGANAWVENNELFLYFARAGCRDENGAILKPGRLRVNFTPNPFEGAVFHQELRLRDGHILVEARQPDGRHFTARLWVEFARPVIHIDVTSDQPVTTTATYESWRTADIELPDQDGKHGVRGMCMINYDAYPGKVFLRKDTIRASENLVRFHHRVDNTRDVFDFQVRQQKLEPVRDQLVNPLEDLVWGGALVGDDFAFKGETSGSYAGTPFKGWTYASKSPARSQRIRVCLHIERTRDLESWDASLQKLITLTHEDDAKAWSDTRSWWADFWNRSRLVINPGRGESDAAWRLGRNYQLFRYMLASNVHGREPTLFNGGLFTFDPLHVNGRKGPGYTPDHRQWGAALTAQNQRMTVWPLLKTGDFDFLPTAFRLHLDGLPNNRARVRHYWGHDGCAFAEQSAITALPGACLYGFVEGGRRSRPADLETGLGVNRAGGRIFETQLEYAWLMLRHHQFSGTDLSPYLPFIEQAVIFYDEHFRYQCKKLTGRELDENGKLVIYPTNVLEGHWDARNPTSIIAGLRRVLGELIALPETHTPPAKRGRWQAILKRLPDMPTGENDKFGGTYLKPSENHEHLSWHCPEMYPLFPYELSGIGMPDLDLMRRTSLATGGHRTAVTAWQQGNIHAARLGDTELARKLHLEKLDNGPWRFPAFWPHDIDWAPDHNWGGCGMIGLQEMLMQTHSAPGEPGTIRLLPAWPGDWDVDFKLHAPHRTTVEARYKSGRLTAFEINPPRRREDVVCEVPGLPAAP